MYNIDPNKLSQMLAQLNGKVSNDDINAALGALKSSNQSELKKQLGSISKEQLNSALAANPALQKMAASNPNFMKNLNSILGNK